MINDKEFLPVNIAVVTISDTRTLENDKSGDVLDQRITEAGHLVLVREIVKDEFQMISNLFSNLIKTSITSGIVHDVSPLTLFW